MRTSAYIQSASDVLSIDAATVVASNVQHTLANKHQMTEILFGSLLSIQHMAEKHGVSQFAGMKPAQVRHTLKKLAKLAFKKYLAIVKDGATLRQQKAFVKCFAKGPNRRAILAAK